VKVLFTVKYDDEKLKRIKELGYEVVFISEKEIENNNLTDDADVMVTYFACDRLDIDKMKNLKYIQTTSAGIDQLPKEKILKNNIVVANNKDGYKVPIGEWIVKSILDICKNSKSMFENQSKKRWKMDFTTKELSGQIILFLGTGNIATEAAKRLKAFDVEIWGINTKGTQKEHFHKCFSTYEMDKALKQCDFVVLAMPSTEDTKHILNKEKIKIMKEGSSIVNIGRGDLINQSDLIDCIYKFRGVALDVVEKEPLDVDSKLWNFDNVIITPHNSWISEKNTDRNFEMIFDNLNRFINDEPLKNVVDIKKGY
jgi:phosphoglycerate dehydrogenase-like enzyme